MKVERGSLRICRPLFACRQQQSGRQPAPPRENTLGLEIFETG